ncbi:MAG TPA: hypothetical protein PKD20_04045 [Candidatus Saccharibacteria bacterium]|jgi:hypothetical protein|nr:hypothetical protein [Candidatus Saccharibacteria bacterium]HMT56021.1 hypothetical protein [Candidatus Saccharibacteria bacterium]
MSRPRLVESGRERDDFDPYRLLVYKMQTLRSVAREAALRGYSHRPKPVRVGSAALAVVEGTGLWGLADGYNTKRTGKDKNCSEYKTESKIRSAGFNKIIAYWIASSTNIDEIEGIIEMRSSTLVPCDVCHGDFEASPIVVPETLIITSGLDHDVLQINTVERLARIMKERDERAINDQTISTPDFGRLLARYDYLVNMQQYIPVEKRLTGAELVVTSFLSYNDLSI